MPEIVPCPVCSRAPDIDQSAPWDRKYGVAPWYAVCYSQTPKEHCFGVTSDNKADAIKKWNDAANKPSGAG